MPITFVNSTLAVYRSDVKSDATYNLSSGTQLLKSRIQCFSTSEKQRKTDYMLTQEQNSDTSLWIIKCYTNNYVNYTVQRLRWSRGRVLAFGTQVRRFKSGQSHRIFQGEKILSTPSFGGEVKPSVPCHRFTACKRFLNAMWNSGISGKIHRPFLAHILPPLASRISGETTSGERWNV